MSRRSAIAATGLGAVAAWVAFALSPSWSLAISATGPARVRRRAPPARGRSSVHRLAPPPVDERLAEAERALDEHVERLVAARSEELERAIARARAESISLLAEQERRFAEERRAAA